MNISSWSLSAFHCGIWSKVRDIVCKLTTFIWYSDCRKPVKLASLKVYTRSGILKVSKFLEESRTDCESCAFITGPFGSSVFAALLKWINGASYNPPPMLWSTCYTLHSVSVMNKLDMIIVSSLAKLHAKCDERYTWANFLKKQNKFFYVIYSHTYTPACILKAHALTLKEWHLVLSKCNSVTTQWVCNDSSLSGKRHSPSDYSQIGAHHRNRGRVWVEFECSVYLPCSILKWSSDEQHGECMA